MYSFYKTMFDLRYLQETAIREAAQWGLISSQQYTEITGQPFN